MKPSSDKPRQIADIHAVRRLSGDRVPVRMEGWELLTETYRCTLRIDSQRLSCRKILLITDYWNRSYAVLWRWI